MTREQAMTALEIRAFRNRIGLSQLCHSAGLSRTIATRWQNEKGTPLLPTIGRLEAALDAIEREKAR
jgi:transcriptional regulator with XRE-family HTH domain